MKDNSKHLVLGFDIELAEDFLFEVTYESFWVNVDVEGAILAKSELSLIPDLYFH